MSQVGIGRRDFDTQHRAGTLHQLALKHRQIERALNRCNEMRERDRRTERLHSLMSLLTPREHEVFMLLVRGKLHKQIAYALGMSERTVKMHRHNVMQKLQVQSLAELAVIAERIGLLPANDESRNEGFESAE